MQYWKSFINSYMTFHYGVGLAIGLVIFCGYIFLIRRMKKSQGQSVSKREILWGLALSIYLILLLGGTLLNREVGNEYLIEWVPFWSYIDLFCEWERHLAIQILYNVLVFIPWGFLLLAAFCGMRTLRSVVLSAIALSFSIEFLQLVLKLGLFEFDDMFHNVLGALIGLFLFHVLKFFIVFRSTTDTAVEDAGDECEDTK